MSFKFLHRSDKSRNKKEDRSVFDLTSRASDTIEKYGLLEDQFIEVFEARGDYIDQIVLIHGGYWRPEFDLAHLRPLAAALSDAGWRVQLIEYRRTPGIPDNYIDDVRAAIIHCGGGILIGHSAGGHLALLASNEDTSSLIKGVIALAPVSDLADAETRNLDNGAVKNFLGDYAVNRSDLDPHVLLNASVPIVIIHGRDDLRVPIDMSRNFNNLYSRAGLDCTLFEIEKLGHFELIDYRKSPFKIILAQLKNLA
jgi:acetyl esterase/lipase